MIVVTVIDDHRPLLPCDQVAPVAWHQLVRDQHGLLDTDQLRLLGIAPGVVVANLAAQRWRRVLPRGVTTTARCSAPLPRLPPSRG